MKGKRKPQRGPVDLVELRERALALVALGKMRDEAFAAQRAAIDRVLSQVTSSLDWDAVDPDHLETIESSRQHTHDGRGHRGLIVHVTKEGSALYLTRDAGWWGGTERLTTGEVAGLRRADQALPGIIETLAEAFPGDAEWLLAVAQLVTK